MLRNTLILPTSDNPLAIRLLRDAIDDLDVVVMLVFGTGPAVEQVVAFADQLANKTALPGGGNLRRVVWIPDAAAVANDPVAARVLAEAAEKAGGHLPVAAVLNFHDEVKEAIATGQLADPIKLELLFLKGHEV